MEKTATQEAGLNDTFATAEDLDHLVASECRERVTVRRAGPADAASIARLGPPLYAEAHAAAFSARTIAAHTSRVFQEAVLVQEMGRSDVHYLLAAKEHVPCGFCKLQASDGPELLGATNAVELSHLYVEQAWIGCGVGAKLMAASLATAAASGYRTCWGHLWLGNTRALSFFTRWGFRQIGRVPVTLQADTATMMLMARDIQEVRSPL